LHLSIEEKLEKIAQYRPIDDVFFEVLARDMAFDQEMLRLILGDENLIVEDVIVQSDERNLYGRSVRLDALCILGDGSKCNVEVQRSDQDDHFRRVRYNASMITVKDSDTGTDFSEVPEVYVVYISESDIFKKNRTIYHMVNTLEETGDIIDDGLHRIFVNTAVHDGTDIADYMRHFTETKIDDPKFPCLTKAVKEIKETEGGRESMCKIMEDYAKLYAREANIDTAIKTAMTLNATTERIVQVLVEEFCLDAKDALQRIEEFKNETQTA
jgi:predicted transposase/invertase (TIGR01784 family)